MLVQLSGRFFISQTQVFRLLRFTFKITKKKTEDPCEDYPTLTPKKTRSLLRSCAGSPESPQWFPLRLFPFAGHPVRRRVYPKSVEPEMRSFQLSSDECIRTYRWFAILPLIVAWFREDWFSWRLALASISRKPSSVNELADRHSPVTR